MALPREGARQHLEGTRGNAVARESATRGGTCVFARLANPAHGGVAFAFTKKRRSAQGGGERDVAKIARGRNAFMGGGSNGLR